jgi:UrcA family protein
MLLRTLATAAILAFGMTAAYADDDSATSTYVTFGDLNLSQPADAKVLADRLQDAAKSVCLKANPEIDFQPAMQNCIDAAIRMAMAQVETRLDQNVDTDLVNIRTSMDAP